LHGIWTTVLHGIGEIPQDYRRTEKKAAVLRTVCMVIPQEWVFSITGRTVEDRRCQLKSNTVDGLLFLCGLEVASGVNALWKN